MGDRHLVEILYFESCPNYESALALVRRVAGEIGAQPVIRLVDVPDPGAAEELRFLGSPTVRVDGRDVEPGADERSDYALACRVYRTEHGVAALPEEAWVRDALEGPKGNEQI